jgi:hypothetical protein
MIASLILEEEIDMKTGRGQKALYSLAALGILGFSVYGIANTVKAANDVSALNAAGQAAVTAQVQGSLTPDGPFCNPYGCAACAGCVSLQYQQKVETAPSASLETVLY